MSVTVTVHEPDVLTVIEEVHVRLVAVTLGLTEMLLVAGGLAEE
jgi:hypothetical protein